jgi:hypothetical protein
MYSKGGAEDEPRPPGAITPMNSYALNFSFIAPVAFYRNRYRIQARLSRIPILLKVLQNEVHMQLIASCLKRMT